MLVRSTTAHRLPAVIAGANRAVVEEIATAWVVLAVDMDHALVPELGEERRGGYRA
jgi:hypothetical protein